MLKWQDLRAEGPAIRSEKVGPPQICVGRDPVLKGESQEGEEAEEAQEKLEMQRPPLRSRRFWIWPPLSHVFHPGLSASWLAASPP